MQDLKKGLMCKCGFGVIVWFWPSDLWNQTVPESPCCSSIDCTAGRVSYSHFSAHQTMGVTFFFVVRVYCCAPQRCVVLWSLVPLVLVHRCHPSYTPHTGNQRQRLAWHAVLHWTLRRGRIMKLLGEIQLHDNGLCFCAN